MVDCSQFLDGYSDFRDGRIESRVQEEYEAHLVVCAQCSRYHRVVSGGVRLFRDLPQLRPSDDFLPRLQHRIFHLDDELRTASPHASGTSAAFALAIAAALALVAWLPMIQPRTPVPELPPMAAHAPQPAVEPPMLFRSGSLLAPTRTVDLHWHATPPVASSLFFPDASMGSMSVYSTAQTVSIP